MRYYQDGCVGGSRLVKAVANREPKERAKLELPLC